MLTSTSEFHKKMEAEEVETGFTYANETEKLPQPSSKAEARRETTFINNPEAEQLDDLSDLEAEPIEVGSRVVHNLTIKFVDRPFSIQVTE
jgi:hypothetical protein